MISCDFWAHLADIQVDQPHITSVTCFFPLGYDVFKQNQVFQTASICFFPCQPQVRFVPTRQVLFVCV